MSVPAGQRCFYRVNSSRASFRELWWDQPRFRNVFGAWVAKILRIKLPGSMNDPNVVSLWPFEVGEEALSEEVRLRLQPALAELEAFGFTDRAFFVIDDGVHSTFTVVAVFR